MTRTKMFEQRKETNLSKLEDKFYGYMTSRPGSRCANKDRK